MGRTLTLIILLIGSFTAFADSVPDDSLQQGALSRTLVFPFVIKSPETNFGFGLAGAYFFKAKKNDPFIRTSDVNLVSLYTLRKQIVVVLGSTVYFPDEDEIFRMQASYSFYPDRFWGLGNSSPNENKEDYDIHQLYFNPQLLFRLTDKWYIGATVELQNITDFNYISGGVFDQQDVAGRNGGFTSGAGLLLTWDTRNNAYSPSKGTFAELNYTSFHERIGSDFNFTTITADFRKFFYLANSRVLGLHGFAKLNNGTVPVRNLALLGGPEIMRGYWKGRYADQNLFAFQAEIRQYLFWRLGVVGFAGAGQVSSDLDLFQPKNFHYSFGGGIRILLQEKEKLNLRIDYGFGENNRGLYVILKEAF